MKKKLGALAPGLCRRGRRWRRWRSAVQKRGGGEHFGEPFTQAPVVTISQLGAGAGRVSAEGCPREG